MNTGTDRMSGRNIRERTPNLIYLRTIHARIVSQFQIISNGLKVVQTFIITSEGMISQNSLFYQQLRSVLPQSWSFIL